MQKLNPREYIKIAIANAYGAGLDKKTWDERIEWVDNNPDLYSLIDEASDPYQFIAAIKAKEDAENGVPTGYIMGLDACSSGIQLMALLAGDLTAAEYCGLIRTPERVDIHQSIKEGMVPNNFTRKNLKEVTMKVMYGSRSEPKRVLIYDKFINSFYDQVREKLPVCIKLLGTMIACHDKKATEYEWELPDHHVANVPVTDTVKVTIKIPELQGESFSNLMTMKRPKDYDVSLAANIIQSVDAYVVRELGLRCNNNKGVLRSKLRFINTLLELTPRYVPYVGCPSITRALDLKLSNIEEYSYKELVDLKHLLINLLNTPNFQQLSVHDKFFCSPKYMNELRQHIINIYAELGNSNLMKNILTSVNRKVGNSWEKERTNLPDLIYKSEYIIS